MGPMKVVCINNQVLLAPEKVDSKPENGLFVPESAVSKVARGVVVSAFDDLVYRVGDVVLYVRDAGVDVRVDGRDLVLVHAEQCLAIERGDGQ